MPVHVDVASNLSKQASEPHIIHFADEDTPWKRLAYLNKPLFWKWNTYREQLEYPYGNFFAPWVLFFIPCVVLAFTRVYYKTAGGGSSRGYDLPINVCAGTNATASAGADESPLKKRSPCSRGPKQKHRQIAILPACGMAACYDGGTMGGSLEAASRYRSSSGGAVGTDLPPLPSLPVGVCYLLSAVVVVFGLVWFRATRALAREVVDASWPPVISVAVYNAWLCCALVLGIYVLDYVYYALVTRGRTFLKDVFAAGVVVSGVWIMHSTMAGGIVWAGAIGIGVIALGVGHGARPCAAYHLSGRNHFRCITVSCVVGAVVSLIMCYNGAKAYQVISRPTRTAAATAQMVFTALVYASVIGGSRLRADMDEAGLKISRSCSTPSFVGDALAVVPGTISDSKTVSTATASHPGGWSACRVFGSRAAIWLRKSIWGRRRVAACTAILLLWKVSASLRPTTPSRRFEQYGQSCLESEKGYVEAGGKRLSKVCGAEQALRPVATGAYFEAFRQDKVCLEVAGGGFLTLGRVHVSEACTPENQFVFQQVQSKPKAGTKESLSSAPAAGTVDVGDYCVYNPTSGFYLSTQSRPRAQCGQLEHWRVKSAPHAPGLKKPLVTEGSKAQSIVSVLIHPNFLSRGPLHTFYGYLLVGTALLIARAVFAKLAVSQSFTAANMSRSSGTEGDASKQRHGALGARQRSRGMHHSRSNNSGKISDARYFGDPGYAGDAEAGSAGYVPGGSRARLSQSPRASSGNQQHYSVWSAGVMSAGRETGLDAEGDSRAVKFSKGLGDRFATEVSLGFSRPAQGRSGFLAKLFSGLCLACDAALLAGVGCLVPAHLSQALSALTHDHHSAIGQGLGMDSTGSRGLGAGIDVGGPLPLFGGKGFSIGGVEAPVGGAASDVFCDGEAWWIISALVRWHLVFLLVAFCHLHGAVVTAAAATATTGRGRNRRTGKRVSERPSFWGLKSGGRLAIRIRTALGVLTLLCASATAVGAGMGGRIGVLFLGLRTHPAWETCAGAVGLDESWGIVSPLLVFAVLAASAGVYIRAGASTSVIVGAGLGLVFAGTVIARAAGRAYLSLAVAAVAMDWAAWGIAGVLSCVCYKTPDLLSLHRVSSDSAVSVGDSDGTGDSFGGGQHFGGSSILTAAGARHRINDARRVKGGRAVAHS